MSHPCPGPECTTAAVPDDMLACSRHWYQVPQGLRDQVWATWRARRRAPRDAQARARHQAAADAAVGAMRPL